MGMPASHQNSTGATNGEEFRLQQVHSFKPAKHCLFVLPNTIFSADEVLEL